MRDHAPELRHNRGRDPPAGGGLAGPFDGGACRAMLRSGRAVRVNEEVRIERDHRGRRRRSCIASRFETSIPSGTPPSTVTHLIAALRRFVRERPASCVRSPHATRSRSDTRSSAARFLAATNKSSGRSKVVFIRVYTLPYLWV